MKEKNVGFLFLLSFLSICMAIWGCASNRSYLVENGEVKIEHVPSKGHLFSKTVAYQEGNEFVISGMISRRSASNIGSGHIDIAIVSHENEILEQLSTYYIPRIIPRERRRGGSLFKVRLPSIPPSNSTVRIAYHRTRESGNRTFHCNF